MTGGRRESRARSCQPKSGVGPASSVPPHVSTRSRRPRRPLPVPAPARAASCRPGRWPPRPGPPRCRRARAPQRPRRTRSAARWSAPPGRRGRPPRRQRGQPLALALQPQRDVEAAAGGARDELLDQREVRAPGRSRPRRRAARRAAPCPPRPGGPRPRSPRTSRPCACGSRAARRCPALAWTTITLIACATMSCSSEAIRARS